ncbi:MAG: hypothetical protein U0587_15545 [Candidatus Binatia bacterium]
MLKGVRQFLRSLRREPAPEAQIELDELGFAVVAPDGKRFPVRWSSVTRVATYKRDNFNTDEIVLAFEVADRPGYVQEVSEEWPGFQELLAPLELNLGIGPSWYQEVMLPAFEANFRVLFDRVGVHAPPA